MSPSSCVDEGIAVVSRLSPSDGRTGSWMVLTWMVLTWKADRDKLPNAYLVRRARGITAVLILVKAMLRSLTADSPCACRFTRLETFAGTLTRQGGSFDFVV